MPLTKVKILKFSIREFQNTDYGMAAEQLTPAYVITAHSSRVTEQHAKICSHAHSLTSIVTTVLFLNFISKN